MKRYTRSLLAIAACAIAFVSCQRDLAPEGDNNEGISITISSNEEIGVATKTEYDPAISNVRWHKDDRAGLYFNGKFINSKHPVKVYTNFTQDLRIVSFTLSDNNGVKPETSELGPGKTFTIGGIMPNAYNSVGEVKDVNSCVTSYGIELPATQVCSIDSYDRNADILVTDLKSITIPAEHTGNLVLNDKFNFKRLFSISKLMFTGLDLNTNIPADVTLANEDVISVTFTSANHLLAGIVSCDVNTQTLKSDFSPSATAGGIFKAGASKSIKMQFPAGTKLDDKFAAWMVCAPVTLAGGDEVTIAIQTNAGTLEYTGKVPAEGSTFKTTHLKNLTINMSQATWTKSLGYTATFDLTTTRFPQPWEHGNNILTGQYRYIYDVDAPSQTNNPSVVLEFPEGAAFANYSAKTHNLNQGKTLVIEGKGIKKIVLYYDSNNKDITMTAEPASLASATETTREKYVWQFDDQPAMPDPAPVAVVTAPNKVSLTPSLQVKISRVEVIYDDKSEAVFTPSLYVEKGQIDFLANETKEISIRAEGINDWTSQITVASSATESKFNFTIADGILTVSPKAENTLTTEISEVLTITFGSLTTQVTVKQAGKIDSSVQPEVNDYVEINTAAEFTTGDYILYAENTAYQNPGAMHNSSITSATTMKNMRPITITTASTNFIKAADITTNLQNEIIWHYDSSTKRLYSNNGTDDIYIKFNNKAKGTGVLVDNRLDHPKDELKFQWDPVEIVINGVKTLCIQNSCTPLDKNDNPQPDAMRSLCANYYTIKGTSTKAVAVGVYVPSADFVPVRVFKKKVQ